jgi:uncharacterized protein YcgI (DUF1989 family)
MTNISPDVKVIDEFTMEPTTGKGLPVYRGQVLRIEQVGNGQCLDLNVYNLHDYKECFNSQRTAGMESFWPTAGNHLWSSSPRDRQMMTLIADSAGQNDLLATRCSAFMNEYRYGLDYHSNCQDIFAEAIREWGLTPDDVHNPFDGFMNTELDASGRMAIKRNRAKPGDYLDLLAQIDVLAVAVCCGGSYNAVSNFENKGLKVTVYEATAEQKARWLLPEERQYKNQRTVADFVVKEIRTKRELERDPSFEPNWFWLPMVTDKTTVHVPFTDDEMGLLDALQETDEWGDTPSEIVRAIFITWWTQHNMRR